MHTSPFHSLVPVPQNVSAIIQPFYFHYCMCHKKWQKVRQLIDLLALPHIRGRCRDKFCISCRSLSKRDANNTACWFNWCPKVNSEDTLDPKTSVSYQQNITRECGHLSHCHQDNCHLCTDQIVISLLLHNCLMSRLEALYDENFKISLTQLCALLYFTWC